MLQFQVQAGSVLKVRVGPDYHKAVYSYPPVSLLTASGVNCVWGHDLLADYVCMGTTLQWIESTWTKETTCLHSCIPSVLLQFARGI